MQKTHPKRISSLFYLALLLLFTVKVAAQTVPRPQKNLISFVRELEERFNIKLSYVDTDLKSIEVRESKSAILSEILLDIEYQTQVKIQKLNDRYYTISKSTTVDICALVLDNFQKNTIPGATVEVLESEVTTTTDFAGKFVLDNVPRKAIIEIRHLGFKPLFVTAEELLTASPCATLLLAQFYQKLDEVVVYEFLTKGLTKRPDASLQMNTEEFGILPGLIEPDVLQTIQALPGIKSIDETVSDINIRGGTNDQNLMLWDGIKMYQSGHFFGLISAFNPYLTDQVTLIKNGTSAQYGDGVSGIIDMRTKNSIEPRINGGAGLNFISGDAYAQIPLSDELAVQFSVRRSVTDIINTPTYKAFFGRAFQNSQVKENNGQADITRDETFYFYDFTGKVLYDFNEDHKFRLSFISINNKLDYLETNADSSRSSQSFLDQTNLSLGGSLDSNWSTVFSTLLNVYRTSYILAAANTSSNGEQTLFQNNEVIENSIKLNTAYQLNTNLTWSNGYQFNETGIANTTRVSQPPYQSDIKGVLRTHALFSEMTFVSKNEKLFARGGGRFNYYENISTFTDFVIEPRLNLSYKFTRYLKGELMGEFKSQATNQIIDLEQNFLGIEKRRWILSEGDSLPVTKSKQASIGINYDHKNLYVGIEGFVKEVNGISTATQGFQNQDQFNGEIGKYNVKGFEFLINKKTTDYSAWLSYTYNVNNYTFDDITPTKFANNLDVRHQVTLAGTYKFNNFKFGAGLNYRSGKPYTKPLETNPLDTTFFPNQINYEVPNSSRLPEYLRGDVSLVYDFEISPKLKASVGASVLNFTDRKNILNIFYRLNDSNEIETIESSSLGLTTNLSFRVKF